MKIVAFGDTHGLHNQIIIPSEADLLLCVGDITEHGSDQEMKLFLKWLIKQKTLHKIIIAGNHDHCLSRNASEWKQLFAKNGITYLYNQMVEIEGLKIYGSPYVPKSGNWSFQKMTQAELKSNWSLVPSSCDILITHGPPFGILDTHHEKHIGDRELYACCQERMPKLHFFGHVHNSHGHMESTLTTYINCACKDLLKKNKFTPPLWQVTL